jgi:hypothetical protein
MSQRSVHNCLLPHALLTLWNIVSVYTFVFKYFFYTGVLIVLLANLPSWQQSLLDQLPTEHSHREILEMLQTSMKLPIIATDGSVKPYRAQGTFAWVLADQDSNPWLRCRGPVSGTPIDSFRSKAHALLSVLVYLNLLADHFTAPVSAIKICIYTDSESNIKRIIQNRHRKRAEFPNETLSPSWDLHQEIH